MLFTFLEICYLLEYTKERNVTIFTKFLYIDFLFQLPMFIVFNLMLFIKVALHVASLQDETKALRGKGLRNLKKVAQ